MRTELLKETSVYVDDLEVAEKFYEEVIGLKLAGRDGTRQSTFQHGDTTLVLFQAPVGDAGSSESGEVTFGISPGVVAPWRRHLQEYGIPIVKEVNWPNGMQSIFLCDPAGNRIHLRTQELSPSQVPESDPAHPIVSRGLSAEWKLYHAARQAINGPEVGVGS